MHRESSSVLGIVLEEAKKIKLHHPFFHEDGNSEFIVKNERGSQRADGHLPCSLGERFYSKDSNYRVLTEASEVGTR